MIDSGFTEDFRGHRDMAGRDRGEKRQNGKMKTAYRVEISSHLTLGVAQGNTNRIVWVSLILSCLNEVSFKLA